jgi:class 3 adenylate cyclase
MQQIREQLLQYAGDEKQSELISILESKPADGLFHINVYGIADDIGLSRKKALELFLKGVQESIFDLSWEYHCPTCGGVAWESLTLADSHSSDYCPVCEIDFNNTLDENIEVFFSVSERIVKIPDSLKKQYVESVIHEVTTHSRYEWRTDSTIYGIDCINHRLFHELFGDETLPANQSLEIKYATILFTDIKESTRMYETLGNAKAFMLVKEHFNIVFDAIHAHGGVPIKTIGDAVMGVFSNEEDGLQSALESQLAINDFYKHALEDARIELKIGLHSGPVLVVTLNNRLDYFGTTVNMAARIQSLSTPNTVVISDKIFGNPKNRKLLKQYTNKVGRRSVRMKGLEGEHWIYSVACDDCQITSSGAESES